MLLMVGKEIRRRMCHVIHQYAEANNKYMIKNVIFKVLRHK